MRTIALIGLLVLDFEQASITRAQGLSGGPFDGASAAVVTCGAVHSFRGGANDGASAATVPCGSAHLFRGSAFDGSNMAVVTCGAAHSFRGNAFDGSGRGVVTCGNARAIAGGGCNGDHMSIRVCVGEVYSTETCITPALPVELIELGTRCEPGGVLLWWITGSETNSAYFSIERAVAQQGSSSTDDLDWESVGTVAAAGHSQQLTAYSFFDDPERSTEGFHGTRALYHRLAQVDLDGTTSYFPVKATAYPCDEVRIISVYPVPARQLLHVRSSMPLTGIVITDALGHAALSFAPGQDLSTLDITRLAPGAYMLEGQRESGVSYARFVVER